MLAEVKVRTLWKSASQHTCCLSLARPPSTSSVASGSCGRSAVHTGLKGSPLRRCWAKSGASTDDLATAGYGVRTSQFKALPTRMGSVTDVQVFSPIPRVFGSWSLLLPFSSSPSPPALPSAAHLSTRPSISLVLRSCRWSIQSPTSACILLHNSPSSWVSISFLKNSHASSFLTCKRCFSCKRTLQNSRPRRNSSGLLLLGCCLIEALSASSLPVASTKRLGVSCSNAAVSGTCVVDLGRPPRYLPVKMKTPKFARARMLISEEALIVVCLSLAERLLSVASGSCIRGCKSPAPCQAPQCAQRARYEVR